MSRVIRVAKRQIKTIIKQQRPATEPDGAAHRAIDADRRLEHLVLHVGAHKTGSTLLQKMLRASASALSGADYAVIPPEGIGRLIGEPPQLWKQALLGRHIEMAARNFREKRPESNLVLSSEELMGTISSFREGCLYPEAGRVVRELSHEFAPARTTVVLYVRRQDAFIESIYLQLVKTGWVDSEFGEFFAGLDRSALDWTDLVRRIEEALPANATLRVKYFEPIKSLGSEGYCRDFAREIDPHIEPVLDFHQSVNRSYSDVALRIARAANPHLDDADRKKLRYFLDHNFTNVTHPKPLLLDEADRRLVLEELAEPNKRLHERVNGATGDPLYFEPLNDSAD